MKETVIDGTQAIFIIEEAESIKEYNSVRIWVGDKEINNPKKLKIVFYDDEEQNAERDIDGEVVSHLLIMFAKLGIDRPSTFDDMVDFIVNDIEEAADPINWHSGDIEIGFRRYLEIGYEG